jgi:hypothetical protein
MFSSLLSETVRILPQQTSAMIVILTAGAKPNVG